MTVASRSRTVDVDNEPTTGHVPFAGTVAGVAVSVAVVLETVAPRLSARATSYAAASPAAMLVFLSAGPGLIAGGFLSN